MYVGKGLAKRYGGVAALRGVDIEIRQGEVHALLGANGAGKSTLVKILVGAVSPDAGQLRLADADLRFHSAADAAARGVASVFQELSLLPDLDVLANIFLMRERRRGPLISRARMRSEAAPILERIGLDVPLDTPVGELPLGEQQLVEISKALLHRPRILLLDEPTSALEARETERLMSVVRSLRADGVGIVYVSHFLEEVLDIADVVTVLRDGSVALDRADRDSVDVAGVIRAMLGKEHASTSGRGADDVSALTTDLRASEASLVIEGLCVPGALSAASLVARPGEIVGLAGLEGAGQSAVFEVLTGLRRSQSGTIRVPGMDRLPRRMSEAVRHGIALIPADRRSAGGILEQSLWENVSLVTAGALGRLGFVPSRSQMRARAQERLESLGVVASSVDSRLDELSGGNQQKVVFAKWLEAEPQVMLLDNPTRGVDVGAKFEMFAIIRELARQQRIVLVRSSELEQLVEICDRVVVFWQGQTTAELSGSDLSERRLLETVNTGGVEN